MLAVLSQLHLYPQHSLMTPSPTGSPHGLLTARHGLLPLCSGCVYVALWFQSFQSFPWTSLAKNAPSMCFLANGPACFLLSSTHEKLPCFAMACV